MTIPQVQANSIPLQTSAPGYAFLRIAKRFFPRIAIIALSLLASSCASTRTIYSGKVISRLMEGSLGAPSGILGCPSEMRILNKDCSVWTYYFTETDSSYPPTKSRAALSLSFRGPACTLFVLKFSVWTDGRVAATQSGSYQPFGRHYYRKLNDEDETDLQWIIEYKAYERSFKPRH